MIKITLTVAALPDGSDQELALFRERIAKCYEKTPQTLRQGLQKHSLGPVEITIDTSGDTE